MYKEKYLKYKSKYLALKSQTGGGNETLIVLVGAGQGAAYSQFLNDLNKDYVYYVVDPLSMLFPDEKEEDSERIIKEILNFNSENKFIKETLANFLNKDFSGVKDKFSKIIFVIYTLEAQHDIKNLGQYLVVFLPHGGEGLSSDDFKKLVENSDKFKDILNQINNLLIRILNLQNNLKIDEYNSLVNAIKEIKNNQLINELPRRSIDTINEQFGHITADVKNFIRMKEKYILLKQYEGKNMDDVGKKLIGEFFVERYHNKLDDFKAHQFMNPTPQSLKEQFLETNQTLFIDPTTNLLSLK